MNVKHLFSPIVLLAALVPALAGAEVTVLGIEIEGLHASNRSGDYDKIIGNVKDTKITVEPAARAFGEFAKCANCCISPANKNPVFYEFNTDAFVASKPMGVAKIYIFSPAGKEAVSSLDALKGKKVGLRAGLPYGERIEQAKDFTKDSSPSAEASIKKLQLGRVDYVLEWTPDMDFAFEKLKMEALPHASNEPVETHDDTVLCKASPETKAFIQELNGFIK